MNANQTLFGRRRFKLRKKKKSENDVERDKDYKTKADMDANTMTAQGGSGHPTQSAPPPTAPPFPYGDVRLPSQ